MVRIIVAEDEPAAMNYILTLLEQHDGIEIIAQAEDGIEALHALKTHSADILITDIQMPRLNGIELAKKVRDEFPDVLTLIVSGYSDFEFAKGAISAGVVEYLLKPFTPAQFGEAITQMSAQVKSRRRNSREAWLRQAVAGAANNRAFPGHSTPDPILLGVLLIGAGVQSPGNEFFYPQDAPNDLSAVYIHNKSEICFAYPGRKNRQILKTLSFDAPFFTAAYTYADPAEGSKLLYDMLRAVKHAAAPGVIRVFEHTQNPQPDPTPSDKERVAIKKLHYGVTSADIEKVKELLVDLFAQWEKEEKTIALMEVALIRFVQFMADHAPPGHSLTQRGIAEAVPIICRESKSYTDILSEILNFCDELYKSIERMSESGKLAESIVEYIHEHLGSPLSAQGICSVFNISSSQLYRVFRKHVKMTFVEYVTELRIEEAKRMFKDSPEAHVKDVSAQLGFSDQFYFSKVFRSITGKSPTEYKEEFYMES